MDFRFRLLLVTFFALLAMASWTLPEWWAFANPESPVAQGLPGLELEARAMFDDLELDEQRAYFALFEGDEDSEIEPQEAWALALVRARFFSEETSAPEATEAFEVPAGANVIATGIWQGIDEVRQAEGDAIIYRLSDGTRLLRFDENFTSSLAPTLNIVFTRNPDPTDERGVGVDFIDVGVLRGSMGAQNYTIPDSVDFSRYPVIALYSREFDQVLATMTVR
ncbi:MAG: DM13 domain-containing protein [Chloroflexota bacterium]